MGMWLLSRVGIKVNPCQLKEPLVSCYILEKKNICKPGEVNIWIVCVIHAKIQLDIVVIRDI